MSNTDASPARRRRSRPHYATADGRVRVRIRAEGAVQGSGIQPFLQRLAGGLGLAGWVAQDAAGVTIEVEGTASRVTAFVAELRYPPPRSDIAGISATGLRPRGETTFDVVEVGDSG